MLPSMRSTDAEDGYLPHLSSVRLQHRLWKSAIGVDVMACMRGHEDLQPKKVLGWENGKAMVMTDRGIEPYDVFVSPQGNIVAKPPEPVPIDQAGERDTRSVEQRWAESGIDVNAADVSQ